MAWKQGPLPKDTWGWGGVVPVGQSGSGFFFADFKGDRVRRSLVEAMTRVDGNHKCWQEGFAQGKYIGFLQGVSFTTIVFAVAYCVAELFRR